MYGYIYKTINCTNNKIYIGQKKSSRFLAEKYLGSGIRLKSAIQHYGAENFKVELIDIAETKTELDDKEIYWISKLNSQCPDIGYNISNGGDGGDNFTHHSEEEKRIIVEKIKQSLSKSDKRGRICVNKDGKNRYILPNMLDDFINEGWVTGKIELYKHKNGYKQSNEWVNNRIKSIMNRTSEQKAHTAQLHSESTKAQMAKLTPEQRSERGKKARQARLNKYPGEKQFWINKDGINKLVFEAEYNFYREQGYIRGMAISEESAKKRSEACKKAKHRNGFTYVYKEDICIRIDNSELQSYIADGWEKGNLFLRGIKKCKKEQEKIVLEQ